jgi:hypothetical protein
MLVDSSESRDELAVDSSDMIYGRTEISLQDVGATCLEDVPRVSTRKVSKTLVSTSGDIPLIALDLVWA